MVIPFQMAHWHEINLPLETRGVVERYDTRGAFNALQGAGFIRTIISPDSGEPLAIVGAVPVKEDEAEVFALTSCRAVTSCSRALARGVRQVLAEARGRFGTLSALGQDTAKLRRWFDWLGFELTGPAGEDRPWASEGSMLWTLKRGSV